MCKTVILLLVCVLHTNAVFGLSSCTLDSECASLAGSVCREGGCVCPGGQQAVLGGTLCRDAAPYYTSPCVEDHQCSHLVSGFVCRKDGPDSEDGICYCQSGFHYFRGRCWRSVDYGSPCTSDVECLGSIRDPFSMSCAGVCGCAGGYYQRQRGECRKIASAVGEACVINEDCQFTNGLCDIDNFSCYDSTVGPTVEAPPSEAPTRGSSLDPFNTTRSSTRQHGAECGTNSTCPEPFICSAFGSCVCAAGYYANNEDGSTCLAQLGSPAVEGQCVGLFAEVREGVCTCQANFFFEEDMRDCTKVTRRLSDSCVADANCHTFGAPARCGAPQLPWGLRSCECDPELAVWDANRDLCRLFAGIGEYCEVDSDCIAGEMQINCERAVCVCPDGFVEFQGLCLTAGLNLGDTCQASQECTGTEHSVCEVSTCACADGYQDVDGFCAPTIGGACEEDNDCTIENTVCITANNSSTCQCSTDFVTYEDSCWPTVSGYNSLCNVSAQCVAALGAESACADNRCVCADTTHYRDGGCWTRIGLFEACSRTSECYLQDMSDRVVCRNSLCQCQFDFPYSEELRTCTSGASVIISHLLLIAGSLLYVMSN